MWQIPSLYQNRLSQEGLVGHIYDAMKNKDYSEVVVVVLDILKKTNQLTPTQVKELKSDNKSIRYRNKGNDAYRTGKHHIALENYNKALLYAPKGSKNLLLAYSNRSALLFTLKKFSACLEDIDTCLGFDCPPELLEKLKKRKNEAKSKLWVENFETSARISRYSEDYFDLLSDYHPQISSASTDIGVIMENKIPKLVAAKDIKVGAIVAMEQPFVSRLDDKLLNTACFYCHKITFNLIPCDECCVALFCDEECKSNCNDDYHNVECKIIDLLQSFGKKTPISILAVRAAMQMRTHYESWDELNKQSKKAGKERIIESEIHDIYDNMSIHSMLNFMDDSNFVHGEMYNLSFILATIVYHLSEQTSFFPDGLAERQAAIRGFCRIAMFLSLHATHTQISSVVSVMKREKLEFCSVANFGYFALTSKLKHACYPNLLAVGLNNEIALVAVQPIKPGTELTISILGHWYDNNLLDTSLRRKSLYILYGRACDCDICSGDWLHVKEAQLTEMQKKLVRRLDVNAALASFDSTGYGRIDEMFKKSCKTLAILSDLPYSREYKLVYKLFRKCLLELQDIYSSNVLIDDFEESD